MWVKIQESRVPASIDYRNPGRPTNGASLNLGHHFPDRGTVGWLVVVGRFCVMFFPSVGKSIS
jgi:hypothetical protein